MATLKTLATQIYNYKNVVVKRIDTIEEGFSTLSCYPTRTWTVNGKPAFTVKIEDQVKLASYLEKEASKGGIPTVVLDFIPECGFYIEMTEQLKQTITGMGKYVESQITETDF